MYEYCGVCDGQRKWSTIALRLLNKRLHPTQRDESLNISLSGLTVHSHINILHNANGTLRNVQVVVVVWIFVMNAEQCWDISVDEITSRSPSVQLRFLRVHRQNRCDTAHNGPLMEMEVSAMLAPITATEKPPSVGMKRLKRTKWRNVSARIATFILLEDSSPASTTLWNIFWSEQFDMD